MFAEVIIDIAHANVDRLFTYRVPEHLNISAGQHVLVPFGSGNALKEGFVLSVKSDFDTGETARASESLFSSFEKDKITSIVIDGPEEKKADLVKDGDHWNVASDGNFRADKSDVDRVVNGMLRNYLRRRGEFAPDKLEPLIRFSMSKDVFSLLSEQYGDEAIRIAEALNEPSEVYLRANTLKADRDEIIKRLAEYGIEGRAAEENSEAIRANGSGIVSCGLYRQGYYSIQSLSSMIAVKALAPEPGSRVLDLCAAPGGKTGYMAELMGNEGSITACDVHPHRLMLTQAAMKRLGVSICALEERDAAVHDASLDGSFDYVLADVPCSGLGVIASKPEIKLTTDPSQYGSLTEIQKNILTNAFRYLKPGGRLEYSTCTLNKNENEEVVKHVLSNEGTSARVIEMSTLMPYNGKVGFYYCIIGKNAI